MQGGDRSKKRRGRYEKTPNIIGSRNRSAKHKAAHKILVDRYRERSKVRDDAGNESFIAQLATLDLRLQVMNEMEGCGDLTGDEPN